MSDRRGTITFLLLAGDAAEAQEPIRGETLGNPVVKEGNPNQLQMELRPAALAALGVQKVDGGPTQ